MRARAAQTSIFSRIVVFLLDRERISVCLGGEERESGCYLGERQNEKSVGSVRGVCVENAGVHYGESVCGSCVLRCVPSCACSVCRVGRDTTPPSERERATCRRMREGRRRTRCVPQRSCGVSHHVCVVQTVKKVFQAGGGVESDLSEQLQGTQVPVLGTVQADI